MARVTFLAVVWILLSPASLLAASFTVNSTMDAGDADLTDGVCATAGPSPVCTLRAAIEQANANQGDDTITVPANTYTLANGALDIDDPSAGALTLSGEGAGTTIIDGGGTGRVFQISSDAVISGVTIRNGHAVGNYGGGLYNSSNGATGSLTLSNVVITGNTADVGGGGIQNDNGTITLRDVTVSNNTAAGSGGGISNIDKVMLDGVTISGNVANGGGGGGIFHDGLSLTLINVTVSGNRAHTHGGGITDNVGATLTNVTISGNSTDPGGASGGNFYYVGDETFMDVIVANSTFGDDCTGSGTLTSGGHNLDGANTCSFTGPGDLINTDPRLGPLQDNGGPTFTEALLPGSPAIDAGAGCPPTDQRGFPRVDGNGDGVVACDIGAFEFGSHGTGTTTTTTITGTTTTTTLPSCSPGATFGSIECRLGVLMAIVGTSVPAGGLHDGLEKSLMKGIRLTGQAEGAPKRRAKRMLGMAAASLGKFKARLHTAKARRTIGDAVSSFQQMAGQIQDDLRTLRGSL